MGMSAAAESFNRDAPKRTPIKGSKRGKHEVYDRLLTGTQVDFQ
jgi:hypothetical protein